MRPLYALAQSTTAPLRSPPAGLVLTPMRIVHVADMYISAAPGAVSTCQHLSDRLDAEPGGYDFLVHPGDCTTPIRRGAAACADAYAVGYARGSTPMWETWHGLITPISSRLPYHVGIGECILRDFPASRGALILTLVLRLREPRV